MSADLAYGHALVTSSFAAFDISIRRLEVSDKLTQTANVQTTYIAVMPAYNCVTRL
jgi:hypothetical protein